MNYVKGILSGLTAIFAGLFGPWLIFALWGVSRSKATGLAAVAGGLVESIFSPLFWGLAILFFALFFATSRLGNKPLRIVLFWIPTLTISTFGIAVAALFTYIFVHFRY